MKYFTLAGWTADQDLDRDTDVFKPSREYRQYLARVQDRLPPAFVRLSSEVCLHDGALRELRADFDRRVVSLQFDAGDPTMRTARRVRLIYEGVSALASTADPTIGLPGPHGYGDLGNDELEVLAGDQFEHRFLFSSGIELAIRFTQLTYELLDAGSEPGA
jgi:hypothetical protein